MLLCYARYLDPTMLCAINGISQVQSKPTTETFEKALILIYHDATYPNAILCYHDRQMVLHTDSATT